MERVIVSVGAVIHKEAAALGGDYSSAEGRLLEEHFEARVEQLLAVAGEVVHDVRQGPQIMTKFCQNVVKFSEILAKSL